MSSIYIPGKYEKVEAPKAAPKKIIPADDLAYEDLPPSPTDVVLRKNLLIALHKKFPGASMWTDPNDPMRQTAWLIDIKSFPTGGVITVRNLWISSRMGFTVKMKDTHDEIENQVLKYAAELFERYNLARKQGFDMRDKLLSMKRDFRGEAIHQ
jgi:hypothetical protein